jgi:pentapeptide repeat protein
MDELELLRQKALALLRDSGQNLETMKKGCDLLNDVEGIENRRVSTRKLQRELSESRVVEFINLLAPYATVLVLAATLGFQFWQQGQAARDKARDRDDALWGDALKSVSEGKALPAIIQLKYFETSPWGHKLDAFQLMLSIFRHSKDMDQFKELFENEFTPVSGENLEAILDLNRALHSQWVDLNRRGDNPKLQYQVILELSYIGTRIAPILQKRPQDKSFDLHFVAVFDCDFSWVDLTNANLEGFVTGRVNLSNANLSGVKNFNANFSGAKDFRDKAWSDTVWWQARAISPEFLAYLQQVAPFTPDPPNARPVGHYGPDAHPTQDQYDREIRRLSSLNSNQSK